ncbi:BSD domain-containing protein [Heracleum sosnowskyi]|uniref:BSD domain-containing protein n=1 Tax=Heracleum sosnowskyi TaxID=360622 RepID=A0AAD8IQQ1_9APIA|nr:BSD domain-containing protein [Heracleum sosnowskyi]
MASWLSLSLFDNNKDKEDDDDNEVDEEDEDHPNQNPSSPSVTTSDISAVISRQFRGVAAFLAPPPISPDSDEISAGVSAVSPPSSPLVGIKNDLVEIGGSFKSKLSLISSNKAVTEFSRFANSLLQFGDDDEEEDEKVQKQGLGLSDEVVSFVEDISERPELWTDFPLSFGNDFDMSDIQREHIGAIEELVPSIAALRHEICKFINEDIFWMIYFILLLPRLNEFESKLLSTPQIVEARGVLLRNLQEEEMAPPENFEVFESMKTLNSGRNDESSTANKRPTHRNEKINYVEDSKEFEDRDVGTDSFAEVKQSEEDSSFSDIESDDNCLLGKQPGYRPSEIPSCSESSDWVELNRSFGKQKTVPSTSREKGSESEESNEWLTIDDSDLDRPAVG